MSLPYPFPVLPVRDRDGEWQRTHFGGMELLETEKEYLFRVSAYLSEVATDALEVQVFADPKGSSPHEVHVMKRK
jgi:hypothetical protein